MNGSSQYGTSQDATTEPTGTEPATARSARKLRLRLSLIYAPVLFVIAGLLAWGAAETEPGDTQNVIAVMAAAAFALFCVALGDAMRLLMIRRHEGRPPTRPSSPSPA